MRQLELAGFGTGAVTPSTLDPESQALLGRFRDHRLAEGANPRTVAREMSHLRSVAREAGWDRYIGLAELFVDIPRLATILCEPRHPIARSTGLNRLTAVRRFISFLAPLLERNAQEDQDELDRRLPTRTPAGWHSTGVVVAGGLDRRRRQPLSLNWSDLERIVQAAGDQGSEPWRRALVVLHCFTGLRPEEIVALRWGAIERMTVPIADERRISISVQRGERHVALPVIPRVAAELGVLAGSWPSTVPLPMAFLFPSARAASRPISYRAARYIMTDACRRAGVPAVEACDLRAAFAFGLKLQGLTDHQVAAVLGLARVRSLDRLLKGHRALQAQHAVREVLETA